jgi:hypothetical protein
MQNQTENITRTAKSGVQINQANNQAFAGITDSEVLHLIGKKIGK